MIMYFLLFVFIIVLIINLLPAFAPPTWLVLSFLAFNYNVSNIYTFVLVAAIASTSGRFILAKLSNRVIAKRMLSQGSKNNISYLTKYLEKHKKFIPAIFLLDAFTPLPSNQLFVAYGLTGLKLRYALPSFFIGRLFAYAFWTVTAERLSLLTASKSLTDYSFISSSFILTQLVILVILYILIKINWEDLIVRRHFSFIKKG